MAALPAAQLAYITHDIEGPFRVAEQQAEAINEQGLVRVCGLEHAALPALAAMELRGIRVDTERWRQAISLKRKEQARLEATLQHELGTARLAVRVEEYEEQGRAALTWNVERKAEELRLMRAYPQVAFRSTWAAFYTAGMAAWKQAHPEPPKPILADEPINLSSTSQVLQALRALGISVTCTQD